MYEIILYKTPSGRVPVEEYFEELSKEAKIQDLAQIRMYIKRLEDYGMQVNNYYHHTIRNVQDGVYELRPGNNRVFFFYYTGNKFVLLHAYQKHSQKANKSEVNKAIKEMKEYKRRNKNG